MKRYYFQILLACCLTLFAGCSDSDSESGQNGIPKGSKAIDLQQDRSGLLRNPCMGWGLYDDAVGNVANAEEYKTKLHATMHLSSIYAGVGRKWNRRKENMPGSMTITIKS